MLAAGRRHVLRRLARAQRDRRHRGRVAARGRGRRRPGRAEARRAGVGRGSDPGGQRGAGARPHHDRDRRRGQRDARLVRRAPRPSQRCRTPPPGRAPRVRRAVPWRSALRRGGSVHVAANGSGQAAATWSAPAGLWYVDLGVGAPAPLTTVPVTAHDLALSESGAVTVVYAAAGGGAHHRPPPAGQRLDRHRSPVGRRLGAVGGRPRQRRDARLVRRWSGRRAGPHPRQRRAFRGAPDGPDARAQRGQADPGRLDRHRRLLADHATRCRGRWRPTAPPCRRRRDLADDDRDRRGVPGEARARPCACACAAATPAATSSAWSVPRCASVAVNDKTLKQKKLAGRAVWKTVKKAKGAYSKDLTHEQPQGRDAHPAGGGPPGSPAGLHRVAGTARSRSPSARTSSAPSPWPSKKGATQVVVPVAVFSGVRDGQAEDHRHHERQAGADRRGVRRARCDEQLTAQERVEQVGSARSSSPRDRGLGRGRGRAYRDPVTCAPTAACGAG